LNKYVIQETPLAVVPPSGGSDGWSFQDTPLGARTIQGVGADSRGKVYRIEVTGYRAKVVNRVSKFRRSNQVFLVPFDQLSQEYQKIHQQGGIIASITPVS
jgi:phycoerythrin-associated linker protein